jgi:membrane associated rhomboid family serine protease
MFQNLFSNMGNITKNLLIINVLFFLAKFILESQGIPLGRMLGLYYPSSQYFEPYQLATHFFMHSDFRHILFNMLGLVFLGSNLERFWGPKKFLIFYIVTALGAAVLHMFVQGVEIYNATGFWFPALNIDLVAGIAQSAIPMDGIGFAAEVYMIPTVGASGAIYGLIMAYAVLFPNTEFMLYFAIPVKAKWLALGAGLYALYQGYQNSAGDSVAHFAHLGGMLFAFILIKIWQKQRNQFY